MPNHPASYSNDFWVITTYYNPARYHRRYQNFHVFRKHLNAPLLAIELAKDGQHQLRSDDADRVIQLTGDDCIWQKERLINHAISLLPKEVEFIAWIDADIIFEDEDWVNQARNKLSNDTHVIQLFEFAKHLPAHINPETVSHKECSACDPLFLDRSILAAFITGEFDGRTRNTILSQRIVDGMGKSPVSPGFAWAAKRDFLEKVPLYDACITGGGDLAFSMGIIGDTTYAAIRLNMPEKMRHHYNNWLDRLSSHAPIKICSLPGNICHLWHGTMENRRYLDRYEALVEGAYDPSSDLKIRSDGAWEWNNDCERVQNMRSKIADYFFNRLEDKP